MTVYAVQPRAFTSEVGTLMLYSDRERVLAHPGEALRRDQPQHDRLHRRDVPEANLWNVESAHHVRPPSRVRFLKCA